MKRGMVMQYAKYALASVATVLIIGSTPWRLGAADQIVGAVSPDGNAYLIKEFSVDAGTVVNGIEFLSNDPHTVFPTVKLLQGRTKTLGTAVVLAEHMNVGADGHHRVRVSVASIVFAVDQDIYVAIGLPRGDRIAGFGQGAGLLATETTGASHSYFASGTDGHLGAMNVEFEIVLVTSGTGKAGSDDETAPAAVPSAPAVSAHPNPFNPRTTIRLSVPKSMFVEATIYDVSGRRVRNLAAGEMASGIHERVWIGVDDAGRRVATGIYLLRAAIGGTIFKEKIVMMK